MRLLTHNQLVCVRKGCAQHYPLLLAATKVERVSDSAAAAGSSAAAAAAGSDAEEMEEAEEEEEEDPEEAAAKLAFVLHVLPTLDYTVLRTAAAAVSGHPCMCSGTDDPYCRALHHTTSSRWARSLNPVRARFCVFALSCSWA
jgi:hypothetical protein